MKNISLVEITCNKTFNENMLCIITTFKTAKNKNTVRLVVDVANCHHKCYMEVFDKNQLKWNKLFDEKEIPFYKCFQYYYGAELKMQYYKENLERIFKHFDKVYANVV